MLKAPRLSFIFPLLLCAIFCVLSSGRAQAFNWNPVKLGGTEYVSLRSVKTFYNFQNITFNKDIVLENRKIKVVLRKGSQRCKMNGVLFILSFPVKVHNNQYLISRTDLVKVIDPVMRPSNIKNAKVFNTVVIDAGHGGRDAGAKGHLGSEKFYTLKVARIMRDMLQKKGYRVVMTRDSDVFVSLNNRKNIANKFKNSGAIFISIHFNAAHARAHGFETFTVSPVGVPHLGRGLRQRDFQLVPGNIVDSASIALATAVHSRSMLYLNNPKGVNYDITDRGIKRARFNVLTGIQIPAILLEGGFLSNRQEAAKVNTPHYQQTLAAAVVRAIDVYKNARK